MVQTVDGSAATDGHPDLTPGATVIFNDDGPSILVSSVPGTQLLLMAGEPLDVMVNGTLVAHGEVVVVNEKFGIRLTDVISAQDRIKKLK